MINKQRLLCLKVNIDKYCIEVEADGRGWSGDNVAWPAMNPRICSDVAISNAS